MTLSAPGDEAVTAESLSMEVGGLTGRDLICFSSIDWDFIWQGHQEIMATLAAQGNRVLFIENTGVRLPTLRDLPRLKQRIRNWRRGTKGFRQERPSLFVYSPVILPFPYLRLVRRINRRLLLSAIQRWMRATGVGPMIVWTFLPTPLIRDIIRALEPLLTIYHCTDDFGSSSPQARKIRHTEVKVFQEADLIFVTSEKLRQRAAQWNSHVYLFPSGVDYERFARVRNRRDSVPEELQALSKPVVGYIGGVHQWIDQELLAAAAAQMSEASFVLVGPVQTDVSRLVGHRNIHLLGPKSHLEVPRYITGFDVGIVPYQLNEYTAHVYPSKLNEYLAMGIPVVTTDLPEIRHLNAQHGGIVAMARDAEEFVRGIAKGVADDSVQAAQRRTEIARQNSWSLRIGQMSEVITRTLAEREQTVPSWQESLRRVYRRARRRVFGIAVGIAAVYLVLFQSSFVWLVAEPLRVSQPPQPADAIVVFAGGVGETGKVGGGGGYQERVKQAVDLYRKGMAPVMIFSSGYTFVFRESQVMRDLAVALGVSPSAILLETQAANTQQNVAYVRDILQQRDYHRVLLVSSPYHMRRAVLVFRKLAPDIAVIASPVPQSEFYLHGQGASLQQIRAILHEYLAIVQYWWKGWI